MHDSNTDKNPPRVEYCAYPFRFFFFIKTLSLPTVPIYLEDTDCKAIRIRILILIGSVTLLFFSLSNFYAVELKTALLEHYPLMSLSDYSSIALPLVSPHIPIPLPPTPPDCLNSSKQLPLYTAPSPPPPLRPMSR